MDDDVDDDVDDDIARAAAVLRAGGLVAFPTETVYGLGADASNPSAVARIFTVKGRPADHPLIVHVASADVAGRFAAAVSATASALMDAFWPGPLTLILPRGDAVASEVTGGRSTVGLRVPDHPVALELLDAFGGGVAAPSANRFGRVSPTTAADVRADLGADVDIILDGGPCRVGIESTIVDLTGGVPEVLRPGGITPEQISDVIGSTANVWQGEGDARAPGMLAAHYAPRARVVLADPRDALATIERARTPGAAIGVLAPAVIDGLPDDVIELEPVGQGESYAQALYARLRQADRLGIDVLVAVLPDPEGLGLAVIDRLERAAHGATPA